jgi:hypothetical protein
MTGAGDSYENAKTQSFFRTLKVEEVYLKDPRTFEEAEANTRRVHGGGLEQEAIAFEPGVSLPPVGFEAQYVLRAGS